jgi:hypothetical protein
LEQQTIESDEPDLFDAPKPVAIWLEFYAVGLRFRSLAAQAM